VTEENLESHINDILNALKDDIEHQVTKEEIIEELNKFMEYGVPIDQAKQTLIKKYGGVAVFTQSNERTLISDLQPNEKSVNLICRVISVNPKEVSVKGDNRKIFYGIFGDESGTIPFTAWTSELDIKKDDVVEISNAYTREWQGNIRLNLGDRVKIEKTDKEKLPETAFVPKEAKVIDLRSGMGTVDVTARIIEINERETEVNGVSKKVFSGVIADETGKAQFTSWHDFKLQEGDVLRISGGYIKSWKGIPQLTFDEKAEVKKLDKTKISKKDLDQTRLPLFKLIEKRGGIDVQVQGTIIEVRPGSGVIMRCPECNRAVQNGECTVHGKVEGSSDLRLKLVIDDGTGSVSTVLNRELTEKIIGKTLDECEKIDENALIDELNNSLFAHKLMVQGNALSDDFGTNVIAKDAELVDFDLKEEAEQLSSELEDIL
jgi:replication factor A1